MSQGMIYNIQRMSVQDGPGLRTTVIHGVITEGIKAG